MARALAARPRGRDRPGRPRLHHRAVVDRDLRAAGRALPAGLDPGRADRGDHGRARGGLRRGRHHGPARARARRSPGSPASAARWSPAARAPRPARPCARSGWTARSRRWSAPRTSPGPSRRPTATWRRRAASACRPAPASWSRTRRPGVAAGRAAGCAVIAVRAGNFDGQDQSAAHRVIDTLDELTPELAGPGGGGRGRGLWWSRCVAAMTALPERVTVYEVGPRDGLQNEARNVPTADKIAFIDALVAAGLRHIEITSFVSPRWIPQLADAAEVARGVTRRQGVAFSALVPNRRGLDAAMAAGHAGGRGLPVGVRDPQQEERQQDHRRHAEGVRGRGPAGARRRAAGARLRVDGVRLPLRGRGRSAARGRADPRPARDGRLPGLPRRHHRRRQPAPGRATSSAWSSPTTRARSSRSTSTTPRAPRWPTATSR